MSEQIQNVYLSIAIFYSVVHGSILTMESIKVKVKLTRKMWVIWALTETTLLFFEAGRLFLIEAKFQITHMDGKFDFIWYPDITDEISHSIVVEAFVNVFPYIIFMTFVSTVLGLLTRWLRDIYHEEHGDYLDLDITILERINRKRKKSVSR